MSGLLNTINKATPNWDPVTHSITAFSLRQSMTGEKDLGLHKPKPVTLLQPTPGDPNIANDQARINAMAAQRSGRASTILSQPNSDSLGG